MKPQPIPRPGETIELAIWLTGEEQPDHIDRWKVDCPRIMQEVGHGLILALTPTRYEIKYPGEDRVPQVPAHVSGPDVRLLVAEADVIEVRAKSNPQSFIHDLDRTDLQRLRHITREAHAAEHPGESRLTDAECDYVIEQVGPGSSSRAVQAAVDGGMVH